MHFYMPAVTSTYTILATQIKPLIALSSCLLRYFDFCNLSSASAKVARNNVPHP